MRDIWETWELRFPMDSKKLSDIELALSRSWSAFERLRAAGEVFSAIVHLAEIHHTLKECDIPHSMLLRWRQSLRAASITEDEIRSVVANANASTSNVRRVLGIGSDFEYEELVLIVSKLVALSLLSEFLSDRGIEPQFSFGLGELAADLQDVIRLPTNERRFRSARAAVEKNWGLPIDTDWLTKPSPTAGGPTDDS